MAQAIDHEVLFVGCLQRLCANYFVKPHCPTGKRSFTFHLSRLCEQLVGNFQSTQSAFGRRISETSSDEKRLKLDAHHDVEKPEHATSNQRCRVCREKYLNATKANPGAKDKDLPKRSKTMFSCRFCGEFLCIGVPGKNCWYDWHHKVAEYWR